jgi:DNA-binding LytR/AlgR family response regulator
MNRAGTARPGTVTGDQASTTRWLRAWFYLGVPLIIGFFLGWSQVGRTSEWPKSFSLLYWYGVTFGSLFFLETLTAPFAAILRPRRVPLWVTLVVAQLIIGWVAILPVIRVYTDWLQSFLPAALAGPLQDGSLASVFQKLPTNIIAWVGLNMLFFYGLGMERFGYVPPALQPRPDADPGKTDAADAGAADGASGTERQSEDGAEVPAFLLRVKPELRGALLALRADGHYLHVYTDAGCDMIHHRLGDALNELSGGEGMQVHRSWWVAERAVQGVVDDKLSLCNGLEVPVSRSYRVSARERGWLD